MCIRVRCKECGRVYRLATTCPPLPTCCECGHQFVQFHLQTPHPQSAKPRRNDLGIVGYTPMSLNEWLSEIYTRVGQKFVYRYLPSDLRVWGLFLLAIRRGVVKIDEKFNRRYHQWKIEDSVLTVLEKDRLNQDKLNPENLYC